MSEKQKLNNGGDTNVGNDMLDEDGDPNAKVVDDPTCWDKTTNCIKETIKIIYFSLAFVINGFKTALGFVCYPVKEQCQRCFKRIDLCFNPYKDATIHEI